MRGIESLVPEQVDRVVRMVVLHHTASSDKTTVQDILRWHRQRGMSAVGYHYVIDHAGRVHYTRPLARVGAHTRGHNRDTIGIALVGHFERSEPTAIQLESLLQLLRLLRERLGVRCLIAHRDLSATRCPGERLYALMDWLRHRAGYNQSGDE